MGQRFSVLASGVTSSELTQKLFTSDNILIKALRDKIPSDRGEYVRVAVRRAAANDRFIAAISKILSE